MPYQVAYHISIQYHIFYTVLKIYSAYVLLFGNIFSLLERIYIFFCTSTLPSKLLFRD